MPVMRVPGASLYYELHGEGPWLAFAHGAGGNHLSWWQQVPAFASRFRCLVYDQRGFGRSTCEGAPDPRCFADDLAALLEQLGAARAALVGQSMGGWTVLGCALRDPSRVTHCVLTSTLAGLYDETVHDLLRHQVDQGAGQPIDGRAALAADFPDRDPALTFLFEEIAAHNPPLTTDFLQSLVALRYVLPPGGLPLPVSFIAGDRDRLFPLELIRRVHAGVSGARLVVVPEAGHSVYFERPQAFNDVLADLLAAPVRGLGSAGG